MRVKIPYGDFLNKITSSSTEHKNWLRVENTVVVVVVLVGSVDVDVVVVGAVENIVNSEVVVGTETIVEVCCLTPEFPKNIFNYICLA